MDVFDRPKYENDLYQPEKLISCDSPLPATPMQIIWTKITVRRKYICTAVLLINEGPDNETGVNVYFF